MVSLANELKLQALACADVVTVDTEGSERMLGFSVAFDGLQQGMYIPFTHHQGNLTEEQIERVWEILRTREALVFHNALHDLTVLRNAGFNYRGKFYDTMLMAHWVNEERFNYSLDAISKVYGGEPKSMPAQMDALIESDGWDVIPLEWMDEYSSNDALITHQLFRKILPDFQAQGFDSDLWEWEQEFIRDVMGPMKGLGIKVDLDFCMREYMRGMGIMEECIKELGFKPSSPKALEKFLIQDLGLPVLKHTKACLKCYPKDRRMRSQPVDTHTAKPSFDKEAMEGYDVLLDKKNDARAQTILRYRGWQKTTSSNYKAYIDLVDTDWVLHASYKLHGTKTGRLSCEQPNLQQIPKASEKDWNGNLKQAFIPRTGFGLFTIDYSQLQFRMAVAYARIESLLDIFNDPSRDIFTEMATQMAWLRQDVKTLVYLILFGGGGKRASVDFGVDIGQGTELVEEFHSMYPGMRKIAKDCEKVARQQGYVALWTGRRRHFKGALAPFYRAFNAVIQGGEAEIIKRAMIVLQREVCDENCRILLQIHDEVVFEIKEGMEAYYLGKAQKVMESAGDDFCKYVGVSVRFATQAKPWGEK